MTTNFFQNIISLNVPGIWKIGLSTDEKGNINITGLFNVHGNDRPVFNVVPPFILSGTAEELDLNFFDTITKPVQETAGILHNMVEYRKGLEKAKSLAKGAEKSAKPDKDTTPERAEHEMPESKPDKKKAYDTAMKTIRGLNEQCKYGEALEMLPQVADYPEKEKELTNMSADLNRKKEQLERIRLF